MSTQIWRQLYPYIILLTITTTSATIFLSSFIYTTICSTVETIPKLYKSLTERLQDLYHSNKEFLSDTLRISKDIIRELRKVYLIGLSIDFADFLINLYTSFIVLTYNISIKFFTSSAFIEFIYSVVALYVVCVMVGFRFTFAVLYYIYSFFGQAKSQKETENWTGTGQYKRKYETYIPRKQKSPTKLYSLSTSNKPRKPVRRLSTKNNSLNNSNNPLAPLNLEE